MPTSCGNKLPYLLRMSANPTILDLCPIFTSDSVRHGFPVYPVHYLLGLPVPGISKHAKCYNLLAAKRVIPNHWLSSNSATQPQLILTIAQIRRMERMTAAIHDSLHQFSKILDPWDNSLFNPETTSYNSD